MGDAVPEIAAINSAIGAEQSHLRVMIEKLRRGSVSPGERNLYYEFMALADPLANGDQGDGTAGTDHFIVEPHPHR